MASKRALAAVAESDRYEDEMITMLAAFAALRKGHKDIRLPANWVGVAGKVADAFNEIAEMNERMAVELDRLSRSVGKEGKLSQRLSIGNVSGFWRSSIESV